MKIYRNKLYSIEDAAKKSGVTEDQIKEMITYHVIMPNIQFMVASIRGEDIPDLKAKWKEWEAIKGKMKKAKITMLRLEKGE